MEKLTFRYATSEDSALILYFIKELAAYENMLNEVVATEELLREWLFEKKKAEVSTIPTAGSTFFWMNGVPGSTSSRAPIPVTSFSRTR